MKIKAHILLLIQGFVVPDKMINDKRVKIGLVLFILIAFLATSTIGILFSSSGRVNSASTPNISGDSDTELYFYISPNENISSNMTKILGDGREFNYTMPGSQMVFSLNAPIDFEVYVFNYERKEMTYNVLVYQLQMDENNVMQNMTPLYTETLKPIPDSRGLKQTIHVMPAYVAKDSRIGVAVSDASLGSNSKVLKYVDINASVIDTLA